MSKSEYWNIEVQLVSYWSSASSPQRQHNPKEIKDSKKPHFIDLEPEFEQSK